MLPFDVDVFEGVDQLETALKAGVQWDVAFIDFRLSRDITRPTGLSAWLKFAEVGDKRPRCVVFTGFGKTGDLYAAACKHWFGAAAMLDKDWRQRKSERTPDFLATFVKDVVAGRDPTTLARKTWFKNAMLVDELFRRKESLRVWRAHIACDGDQQQMLRMLHVDRTTLNRYNNTLRDAVIQVEQRLLPPETVVFGDAPARDSLESEPKAHDMVASFASRHDAFFGAPDLPLVIEWLRNAGRL